MMFKAEKHKTFDYTPLYYKPEKDPEEKLKQRIRFKRSTSVTFPFTKRFFFLILLIIFIVYVLKKLAIFF